MKSTAHLIVLGNEKGGSGKSTTAMHVAIGLLRLGYRVGSMDLDARQGTLTRYMANRFDYITRTGHPLPSPFHMPIERSKAPTVAEQETSDHDFLMMALEELGNTTDFVVIDTPGSDTYLGQLAHSYADTLITPLNDSFVDLDVLARINPETREVLSASVYTNMVFDQKKIKMQRDGIETDWIVMRNRLSSLDARNKRDMQEMLEKLAQLFHFRLAPGFGERVTFREMFLKGLTLLDMKEDPDHTMTLSALSARQEVRELLRTIGPERFKGYPQQKPR